MIPDYQTCMLPLLKYAGDNNEHKFSDAVDYLSNEFNLTQEERKELLPSKTQDVITNRIGWARTYMKKAGLLEDFLQNTWESLMSSRNFVKSIMKKKFYQSQTI